MAETFTYDKLFAGHVMPQVTEKITIASGAGALKRGTVVAKLTSGGKAKTVDSTKSDGTQTPYGILSDDVDATSADKVATVYVTGEFNEAALIFSGEETADTFRTALRQIGIFLKPVDAN